MYHQELYLREKSITCRAVSSHDFFFFFVDGRPRAAKVGWAGLSDPGAAVHRLGRF